MNRMVFCQNIKKTYHNNCNDFVLAEMTEIELKFVAIFIGLSGILYLKNNKDVLSELLFQIGYKSFLAATKVSNAYRRIKNFFVFSDSHVPGKGSVACFSNQFHNAFSWRFDSPKCDCPR